MARARDPNRDKAFIVNTTYYHHSTADDNLFLPVSYIEQLDEMALYDPDLHRIARKGRFGVNGVLVLQQFETKPHDEVMSEIAAIRKPIRKNGMDFGFVDSYNALLRMVVDHEKKWLYIYWEYYKRGMTDDKTADELEEEGLKKSIIKADNAEPKTIAYYKQRGFRMYIDPHTFSAMWYGLDDYDVASVKGVNSK